jgi:hypothetical protein
LQYVTGVWNGGRLLACFVDSSLIRLLPSDYLLNG